MRVTSSTELRANLSKMMDQVNADHTPLIITRSKGAPAVLMSLEDYQAMDETTYLTSSPANAERLKRAIERASNGDYVAKDLIEP